MWFVDGPISKYFHNLIWIKFKPSIGKYFYKPELRSGAALENIFFLILDNVLDFLQVNTTSLHSS